MYKDLLSKMAGKNEYMVVDRLGRCVAFANKHNQSGFARPRLAVTTPDQKNEIIVIVDSEVDIWPALRAYYERNRPEWRLQSDNVYFLACATAVGHQRKILRQRNAIRSAVRV